MLKSVQKLDVFSLSKIIPYRFLIQKPMLLKKRANIQNLKEIRKQFVNYCTNICINILVTRNPI